MTIHRSHRIASHTGRSPRALVRILRWIAAGSCLAVTACANIEKTTQPVGSVMGASGPVAMREQLAMAPVVRQQGAGQQALTPQVPLAQPSALQQSAAHPPAARQSTPPPGVVLASHASPPLPSPAPATASGARLAPPAPLAHAVHQEPLANAGQAIRPAQYLSPLFATSGAVRQVDWSQCPSCLPVTLPGPDCLSVEVDAQLALRYRDEYICDGGDSALRVELDKRMRPNGLDQEDTVAHYTTEDGLVVVEPSTRTCIYAPRFAAVRQVHSLAVNEQSTATAGIGRVAGVESQSNLDIATNLHQPIEPKAARGATKLHAYGHRTQLKPVTGVTQLIELGNDLLPFENLALVRHGDMLNSDKVRLATSVQNAIAWTGDESVEAILDETPAVEAANVSGLQETYEFIVPKGKPKLRVVKLADRDNAHPSDEVQFTIRFDNIGDAPIRQVVLLDNLSTRLEYIEDSAESTIKAEFTTEPNQGESLILRWELQEQLPVGQGGVIRFRCRVR